ncbi:MAG TPA: hypothetical protein VMT34_07240, partial [Aggregatilineales bacterium]|nr:hypothetical protein [Aggregatilineales bacterium]
METSNETGRSFPIDTDHGLINILVPSAAIIMFIAGCVITYAVLNTINADLSTLAGLLPIAVAILAMVVSILAVDYFGRRLIPPRRH